MTPYRRDAATWAAFGALFGFGYLNAVLGPALPYIRSVEHISYLTGALHQVAWAIGGGLAGVLAAREAAAVSRRVSICAGLVGAGLAGLALAYGNRAPLTIPAALVMSLLATTALIALWALLADRHGPRRAVAMTEGEVAVSLAGITTPLLIGAFAATALSWRFALVIGLAAVGAGAGAVWINAPEPAPAPTPTPTPTPRSAPPASRPRRLRPTLVIILLIVALEFALTFWLASYLNDDVRLRRDLAVVVVSGLYAANLFGRLLASRLARRMEPATLLACALALTLLGLPPLLAAGSLGPAAVGIVLTGAGIGALFPLTSSLHVAASPRTADAALGEILTIAAFGQVVGPVSAALLAQIANLRVGLLVLPAFVVLAAGALAALRRDGGATAGT